MRRLVLLFCLFLFACAKEGAPISSDVRLSPYSTVTPSATPEQVAGLIVSVETPFPTATPFAYIVKAGDTMSQIAETYHVSLDDLMAANPNVSPNSMTIGQTLLIPSVPANPANASSPTPAQVSVKQIVCHPTTDRGLWCFALIRNDSTDILENVSAQIALVDANGATVASQAAYLPLNILPPNQSLPLYVFFPQASLNVRPQMQILTAFYIPVNDPRYLPATISNTSVEIGRDGHNAKASGQISLPAESNAATQVWVAAVAYDEYGRVVGVKRWEGGAIQPGTSVIFYMTVASVESKIARVEFVVEARP